jgi:integrating conjugative element protein (TIGR03749 family)
MVFATAPHGCPTRSFARCSSQWITAVLAAGVAGLVAPPEVSGAQAGDVPLATTPAPEPVFKEAPSPVEAASRPRPSARAAAGTTQRHVPSTNAESTRPSSTIGERVVWDKSPLQISLGVGPDHERPVTFPAQMHIGVPPEIAHLLRVQTVGRTSYFTALAPFARSRVLAEDRATGAVILLDMTASKDSGAAGPLTIVIPPAPAESTSEADMPQPVDMVTLTRFAAQQLYAPRRLAMPHPAIRRVLVDVRPIDDLYAGGGVRATPTAQWRSEEFHLTAVVLQNLRPEAIELDPLQVRGRWHAITFHDGRLHARGSEADTTVVYLVCDRSFETCR